MARKPVLVVEDDAAIRRGLVDALDFAGYPTLEAADGDDGLRLALRADIGLVILDLILPRRHGFEILREVRATRPTLPVIILTARGREKDRVEGLRLGSDDYVVKPFSVEELLARVAAVLRRSPERPTDLSRVPLHSGVAHLDRGEVLFDDGGTATLSELEARLLQYLARNRGRTLSRDELLSRVWRIEPATVDTRTVDMQVARLRVKLREPAGNPRSILTVRGKGYRFAGPPGED